jgi:adenosylcobinamide-phosphate guanylyltransferase
VPPPASSRIPAVLLCGGRGTRLLDACEDEAEGTIDVEYDEKPLVTVGERPMVDRVLSALIEADSIGSVHAVASPHAPETIEHLEAVGRDDVTDRPEAVGRAEGIDLVVHEGTGEGYVADLRAAIETVGTPALTVVADLPLLRASHVDATVERFWTGPDVATSGSDRSVPRSLSVCVPAGTKRRLGVSVDATLGADDRGRPLAPTGLNVVGDDGGGNDDRDARDRDDDHDAGDRHDVDDRDADDRDEPGRRWIRDDPALAVNVNRPGDLAVARDRI